jgi:flagellin
LQNSQTNLAKSISRLSSGNRLTSPADDAAGVAVTNNLDAQVNRLQAARTNVSNGISFTQTQDGYLNRVAKALDRMSELSILAQDATKSDSDRNLYNKEYNQLIQYVSEVSKKDFNGVSLFTDQSVQITVDSEGGTFEMLGIDLNQAAYTGIATTTLDTKANAATALDIVKGALTQLGVDRAAIGSYQSRMNYTSEQLVVARENLMAASSRIKDTDMAEESTEYARQNILVQSGTAMLAQANAMPQSVLRLLQG